MNKSNKRIAVIGAGPMGLAVAYQLVKDGYHPQIFEADDRIGGMSASFDFFGNDIERFYHFHCTSDYDFFKVLDELGLVDKLHWVNTKMGYWSKGQLQRWGDPISLLTFRGLSLISKLRYAAHVLYSTKISNWHHLDKLFAINWIKAWVGSEAYEVLWSKLFELKFYEYSNQISAAWIWARIRRIGRSRDGILKEKLGYLEGGSETLLIAMRKYIENNSGVFNLSLPVLSVNEISKSTLRLKTKLGESDFNAVISTIPLPMVPNIFRDLPQEYLERYRSIKNIGVVCVVIKVRKKITDYFWLNINDSNSSLPGLVEYTNLRNLGGAVLYAPFYLPINHPDFTRENDFFSEKVKIILLKINPQISSSDIEGIVVNRTRYAQPICTKEFLSIVPPPNSIIKNLWIADTSSYYPEDRGISESIGFGRNLAREVDSFFLNFKKSDLMN